MHFVLKTRQDPPTELALLEADAHWAGLPWSHTARISWTLFCRTTAGTMVLYSRNSHAMPPVPASLMAGSGRPRLRCLCAGESVRVLTSTGTGCPGRLWSLLLWRYSILAWTSSCAACCRWPCFSRRIGLDDRQWSLPTPTILWFCDLSSIKEQKKLLFPLKLWKSVCRQTVSVCLSLPFTLPSTPVTRTVEVNFWTILVTVADWKMLEMHEVDFTLQRTLK